MNETTVNKFLGSNIKINTNLINHATRFNFFMEITLSYGISNYCQVWINKIANKFFLM